MSGLKRHLEGWQLAVLSVTVAVLAAVLAIPRAVEPGDVPPPRLDHHAHSAQAREDNRRAELARQTRLPFEVRAVGEALRQYGAASAARDSGAAATWLRELTTRVAAARRQHGDEALLGLRSLQLGLFLKALRRWESAEGAPDVELVELGGNFADKAQLEGWVNHGRVVMTDSERRAAFRIRWVWLTGLRDTPPFQPGTNEWRAYYGFLLRHPETKGSRDKRALAEARLGYVKSLSELDPSYPGDYARGVLLFDLGSKAAAADAFRQHLKRHPNGRWTLRARNYHQASVGVASF